MTTSEDRSALQALLAAHPDIRWLDAFVFDVMGKARGKRYPIADAPKILSSGMRLPLAMLLLDPTGMSHDPGGRGVSDGDPDGLAVPVPGTLVPVPWDPAGRAQVLCAMHEPEGDRTADTDARGVLQAVEARLRADGLHPTVAVELEFYLIDPRRDGNGRPCPATPPGHTEPESGAHAYGLDELDRFAEVIRAIEDACAVQSVPSHSISAEYAPGQFEVNLRHQGDAVRAADHAHLLRRIVGAIAERFGLRATFMPKPFAAESGSGLHIHVSLQDGDGRDLFQRAGPDGINPQLRHALGGLAATMAEGMAIFAPSVHAYRRLQPANYVPVNPSWGFDNRSVAFRIPPSEGEGVRIEHRPAGADANAYLVLATVLAGIHHGITHRLDPGPAAMGDASGAVDPALPRDINHALLAFERGSVLRAAFGDAYWRYYLDAKRGEVRGFFSEPTAREFDWYL